MLRYLGKVAKKYFIPHEHNNYKPHLLRWEVSLAILTVALVAEIFFLLNVFFVFPRSGFFAAILPGVIVEETNASRNFYQLGPLTVNPALSKAAEAKAHNMAKTGYFSHYGPDGKTPWAWMQEAGYVFDYAGENLAVNFLDSEDVMGAWMRSSSHRENILKGEFTEIGIGIAEGKYEGRDTIFVAQMFGRPASASYSYALDIFPKVQNEAEEIASSSFIAFSQEAVLPISEETQPIAGVTRSGNSYSLFFARVFSNPARLANAFYLTLATLVALALLLKIFINVRVQHPRLIINGVMMILVLGAIVVINQYIVLASAKIL